MTDKQFLQGMWCQVEAIAHTANESEQAKLLNQRILKRELLFSFFLLVAGAVLSFLAVYASEILHASSFVLLPILIAFILAASIWESRQYKTCKISSTGV